MKPWFGLGKLELAAFVFFSLFLLLQCLSIAAANVALGFSVFFILCLLISAFKTPKRRGSLRSINRIDFFAFCSFCSGEQFFARPYLVATYLKGARFL